MDFKSTFHCGCQKLPNMPYMCHSASEWYYRFYQKGLQDYQKTRATYEDLLRQVPNQQTLL